MDSDKVWESKVKVRIKYFANDSTTLGQSEKEYDSNTLGQRSISWYTIMSNTGLSDTNYTA